MSKVGALARYVGPMSSQDWALVRARAAKLGITEADLADPRKRLKLACGLPDGPDVRFVAWAEAHNAALADDGEAVAYGVGAVASADLVRIAKALGTNVNVMAAAFDSDLPRNVLAARFKVLARKYNPDDVIALLYDGDAARPYFVRAAPFQASWQPSVIAISNPSGQPYGFVDGASGVGGVYAENGPVDVALGAAIGATVGGVASYFIKPRKGKPCPWWVAAGAVLGGGGVAYKRSSSSST